MHSRFTALDGFDSDDLTSLQESTAAIVGLGATGSVIAEHLARHGVNLIILDRDYLEENDAYSSSIYTPEDCKKSLPKAETAGRYLSQFTEVESYVTHLSSGNLDLLDGTDIVMDGTDNLETRFLLSEYSQKNDVPWIYTAALAEKGYSMLFNQKCFSCIFDEVKAGALGTCETEGVMREISSITASISSYRAVRYLAGKEVEKSLAIAPSGERLDIHDEGCEVCRGENYPHMDSSDDGAIAVCGENKYQITRDVSEKAAENLIQVGEVVANNDYLTRVIVDGKSFTLFNSGRAIIEARDRSHAEAKFDRIIGN